MQGWARGVDGRLALLQALLGGAGFAAETLAETLVIGTLGPTWLPVGLSGAAMLSLALTTGLTRRPAGPRRLPGLAGVVVVVGLIVWRGLFWAPTVAALLFLLVSRPLRDALAVTSGNLISSRYDAQAAKRAWPRLAAASQTGAILIGLSLPILLRIGGDPAAVMLWPILAAAAAVVAWRFPLVLDGEALRSATKPTVPTERPLAMLRRSPLLMSLAITAMLAVATGAALGLAAAMLLSAAVPDPARLASLYAVVGVCSGIGILIVQTIALPWLLRRFGTAQIAAVTPVLAIGVTCWVIAGGGLAAGVAAQAGRLTLRPAMQTPIEEILLGLLPVSMRSAGRAWLRGGAVPIAGLVSSLGLAALAALGAHAEVVGGLALMMAIGGLVAALFLRRQHRQAALALARGGDVLAQRVALPAFGSIDATVKDEITRQLTASTRDDERQLLIALLADVDPTAATAAVAVLLADASPTLTAALLSSLAERRCPAASLLPHAPLLLAAPTAAVRRAALAALATTPALNAALVVPLLDDSDPEVALMAVERLIEHDSSVADQAKDRLLALAQAGSATVKVLMTPLLARAVPEALAPFFGDPSVAVRRAAAHAAGDLATVPDTVASALLVVAGDGASPVRIAAVAALSRLGAVATPTVVIALNDPVSSVRAAAVTTLLEDGTDGARRLARHLPTEHGWGRATGLAILAHGTPWRWRTALQAEEAAGLTNLTHLAMVRTALGPPRGPVGALLRRDIDDTIKEGITRWRECLTITDGIGAERVILHGLAAEDSLVRAHAQEALEAVRSPGLARQAARLLESISGTPRRAAANCSLSAPPDQETMDALAVGGGHWRRMLLAAVSCEEPGLPTTHIVMDSQDREDGTMLSLVERATLLQGVPPFADLSSEQLRILAGVSEEIEVVAGETLIAAGSEGDHLYVIVTGQIALEERRGSAGSVARVATLGQGAALGEDAVFDGGTHVLNATAVTDCRLLALNRAVLLTLIEEQPALARTLIAWLSARLRETSGKLAERTRPRPRSVVDLLDKMGEERR